MKKASLNRLAFIKDFAEDRAELLRVGRAGRRTSCSCAKNYCKEPCSNRNKVGGYNRASRSGRDCSTVTRCQHGTCRTLRDHSTRRR